MGGRFGKYGDIKRKERLRRNRPLKKQVDKVKHVPRKGRTNRIKPQARGKLNLAIDTKP